MKCYKCGASPDVLTNFYLKSGKKVQLCHDCWEIMKRQNIA